MNDYDILVDLDASATSHPIDTGKVVNINTKFGASISIDNSSAKGINISIDIFS